MAFVGTFKSEILADSRNPAGGRLTTMELTYPRVIHSEFMTHRYFSRNAASSRAIPIKKMLDNIREAPFVPLVWGTNMKGMQAGAEHDNPTMCEKRWLAARDDAVHHAGVLSDLGLHKQIVNRIVEPWMWITVIASGIDKAWENFFKLRCHEDAEPHIQKIGYMAREQYDNPPGETVELQAGEDHLPLVGFDGDQHLRAEELRCVSTARCARVSYRTHDGRRDVRADLDLHDQLATAGHWSPFEHVATAAHLDDTTGTNLGGNFGPGWVQYRKIFENECCNKAPR